VTASEHGYSRSLTWNSCIGHFDAPKESVTTYPSKEVARGYSEVVVINPSDARWLVRKAEGDYENDYCWMRE
jgi:hypothetical protein